MSVRHAVDRLRVGIALFTGISFTGIGFSAEPERWFLPGPLGHEGEGKGQKIEGGSVDPSATLRAEDGRQETGDGGQGTGDGERGAEDRSGKTTAKADLPTALFPRAFLTRAMSGVDQADGGEWARRNGLGAQLNFSHNLSGVFPPALYDRHPEFFPFVKGQRLRPPPGAGFLNPDLGRPDVAIFAAGAARAYFAQNPASESFALGVNDGLVFGESPETMALVTQDGPSIRSTSSGRASLRRVPAAAQGTWFRGRPDYSRLVFTFMNRAAAELERSHPDKYLGALAYYWAENAPPFPVHRQVVPFLTADRSQGYDRGFREEERELQRRWARAMGAAKNYGLSVNGSGAGKLRKRRTEDGGQRTETKRQAQSPEAERSMNKRGQTESEEPNNQFSLTNNQTHARATRLGLYDYIYGAGFLVPRLHPHLLADNLRQARRIGFTDYYAEVQPNWGLDGPQPWLVAQLLLDPEQPADVLLDEYYRRYFQEAAEPMRRFFERCERQWLKQKGSAYWLKHYRNESQAALFPSAVCRELRALLTEAETIADRGLRISDRGERPGSEGGAGIPLRAGQTPDIRWRGPETGYRRTDAEIPDNPYPITASPARVRERVQLVSDAFGATERFVAFQEARVALNRRVFAARTEPKAILDALKIFLTARAEWLSYMQVLNQRQPLALAPSNLQDFTHHDPVVNALVALNVVVGQAGDLAPGHRPGLQLTAVDTELRSTDAALSEIWREIGSSQEKPWRELCRNGGLQGPLVSPRQIAGLDYGVPLPAPWGSKVEPAQFHRAERVGVPPLLDRDPAAPGSASALRVTGTKDTAIFQWNLVEAGAFHLAQVNMRGRIGPGCAATLTFGWLDANRRNLGFTTMRLPEGKWPRWLTLSQGGKPPAGAAWVGVGIRVEHQIKGDWLEVRHLSLKTPSFKK